jgi:amino acid adenylation domain-containing protein
MIGMFMYTPDMNYCEVETDSADAEFVFQPSFDQQRLWLIDQLRPNIAAYNLPVAIRIHGKLNVAALERSLNNIVQRHESLRTTFRSVEGVPMQFIAQSQAVMMPVADLRELEPAARVAEEQRLIVEEAWTPFDLARRPLIRTRLLRTSDQTHVLTVNSHHIIGDYWSEEIFLRELITGYEAFTKGREPKLPDLQIQYADFAHWQRNILLEGALKDQLTYWREKLADLAVLRLPADRRRPSLPTFSGASAPIELSAELSDALKALSQRESTTVFMTLLAAFNVLLMRYTGQEDIAIGSPITNRTRSETENLIGFFVNTLVLRTVLTGNPTFREALRLVRETALGAFQHQDVPFDVLVKDLAPERHLNQNPLFQVAFVLLNARPRTVRMGDLVLNPIEIEDRGAMFDLTMSLFHGADGIRGSLVYNIDLFEAATMQRMADHFRTLVSGIVANPDARISQLPLLSKTERRQIVLEYNQTETEFPRDASINEIFEKQAVQNPNAVAVEHNTIRWTYRQLNRRANRLARRLRAAGAGRESLIAICLERSADMIAAMLAILKAGAAYVPIDPTYPAERRSLMLADVPLLVTTRRLAHEFADCRTRVVCMDDEALLSESFENLPRLADGDSLAYVIYTSGSTGQPKGVAVTHRGVNRLVLNTNYITFGPSDVVAQTSTCCFDAATFEIWGALLNGARLVVIDRDLTLSPTGFLAEIERREITTLWLTTSLFNLMAEHTPGAFAKMRNVLFGGEAADPRSVAAVLRHGAPTRLVNGYGPTETTTFATCHEIRSVPEDATTIPIGRPISNTTVYILDAFRNPVPVGVAGEIYIGGPGVARGYIGAPELTRERFVPDPFANNPSARLYKTGDLARWLPDGSIDCLGRIDHQVKIRGFRIEPGEIEAALKQHPEIELAVVIVREYASGDKRLIAYVASDPKVLSDTAVRNFLKPKLPDYMLPSAVVVLEKLPLNANGKIDRHALPEPAANPGENVSVPPRDALETKLVEIWEKVLKLQPIGITDDFFRIGGHSLLAVGIFSEIEKSFGQKLPLAALFQAPTIETLADVLRNGWKKAKSPVAAIQPLGSRPPFFNVHDGYGSAMYYRLLADNLGQDQPFFGFLAQDRGGGPIRQTTIETIAAYYIDEMRQVRPTGPYYLGGFCLGGLVAFEMAQQLHAAGEKVALLVLFDTQNPARPPRRYTLPERFKQKLRSLNDLPVHDKFGALAKIVAIHIKSRVEKWRSSLQDYRSGERQPLPSKVFEESVHRILLNAQSAYQPLPYPGRLTLILPEQQEEGYELQPERGWGGLAGEGIEIHYVPGQHGSIFGQSYVGGLAAKVDACLQTAFEQSKKGRQSPAPDLEMVIPQ